MSYFRLVQYQEAIAAYKEAIRLNSNNSDAHYNLGEVYYLRGDTEAALEEYKILLKISPQAAQKLHSLVSK